MAVPRQQRSLVDPVGIRAGGRRGVPRQAEIAGQYLTKGKQVFVEGRLQTRSWEDRQTGEKRYRTEIVCSNFQMLGMRGGFEGEAAPQEVGGPGEEPGPDPADDDIPF